MHSNYRDRALLDVVYLVECTLQIESCCEGGFGEPAHSNQSRHGKGGALKAHDCFVASGCRASSLLRTDVVLWRWGLIPRRTRSAGGRCSSGCWRSCIRRARCQRASFPAN